MWIIENLGIIDYQKAYEYQEHLVSLKQSGGKNNFFLLLQHFPVFTRGKSAKDFNLLDKNIPVIATGRGGDMTYHEPGQLIGYIILDLKKEKLKVKEYISGLEDLIIFTLGKINLNARKKPDNVGVWVEDKKIASIGVGIKKGITMHGFALNINNSLDGFKKINPCGLKSCEISSLKHLTGEEICFNKIQKLVIDSFKHNFYPQHFRKIKKNSPN